MHYAEVPMQAVDVSTGLVCFNASISREQFEPVVCYSRDAAVPAAPQQSAVLLAAGATPLTHSPDPEFGVSEKQHADYFRGPGRARSSVLNTPYSVRIP